MFRIIKLGTVEKLILSITTSRFSSGAKYTASSITATFYKVNGVGDALEIDTAIGTSGVVTLSADTGSKTGFHTALLDVSALTAKIYCVVFEATVDSVAAISHEFLDIDAERKKVADYVDASISSRGTSTYAGGAVASVTGAVGDARLNNLDAAISTRSTLTAQQVWEYATRTVSSLGTLVADIWAYATRTLSDKTGFSLTSAYDPAKTAAPTVGQIDTQLSSSHGSDAWGSSSGTGANEITLLVETSAHVPIAGISIQIFNSDQTLLVATGSTSLLGQCVFALDDATYKVRLSKVGYNFTVPETLTVSGATTDTYEGEAIGAGTPSASDVCRVYDYLYQPDGTTKPAVVVAKAKIVSLPYDYSGKLHNGLLVSGTYSASTGLVYWDLAYGCKVQFTVQGFLDMANDNTAIIPAQASIRLVDLIGRE